MSDATNYAENKLIDHLLGTASFTMPTNTFVKLHIGAPGEDATGNPAGETTRKEANFNAGSNGAATLAATVSWTNVSTAETYSHFSIWDAVTGGNPLVVGALAAAKTVGVGDNFDLTALTVTIA